MYIESKSSLNQFRGYMNRNNERLKLYEYLRKEGIATGTYKVRLESVKYNDEYKTANLQVRLIDPYKYSGCNLSNVTIFIDLRDTITKDGENHGMRTMVDIFRILDIDEDEVESDIKIPVLEGLSNIVDKYLLAGYKNKEFLAYIINRYGARDFGRERNYFFYPVNPRRLKSSMERMEGLLRCTEESEEDDDIPN